MAKLYFYYSAMNAGKSTALLQANFNYQERGIKTLCFLPSVAAHFQAEILSRIGLKTNPMVLEAEEDLVGFVRRKASLPGCILVDEAQFLSVKNVDDLCILVDEDNIPVLTYGLRTDFQGQLFVGSQRLLAVADHLSEIKTICFCGRKAILTARVNAQGKAQMEGDQIDCGGNDKYISFCRKHHRAFLQGHLDPFCWKLQS